MSDTNPKSDSGVGYEPSDVQVPVILKFGVVLVLMIAFSGVASWAIFGVLFAQAKRADPKLSPLAVIDNQAPPEPRLIVDEPVDLRAVQAEEAAVLQSYDWVDQSRGVVRIPIERAMELLAKESSSKGSEKTR